MQIQDLHDQMVSMTQVRRDVNVLKRILARRGEAWVMKNQEVVFVAVAPQKYQKIKENETRMIDRDRLNKAIVEIDRVREAHGPVYGSPGTDAVIRSRDDRRLKWSKK